MAAMAAVRPSARAIGFARPGIVPLMERQYQVARGLAGGPLEASWLGRVSYRDAWDLQHRLVAARAEGRIGDQLILLEHEPVLTLGRHSDPGHVLAGTDELVARGIELIRTERGGEVTYHGPGQLTGYPIIKLADRGLLIRPLVRALESALTGACSEFGVEARPRPGLPGCWCGGDPSAVRDGDPGGARKIGAIGIRIEHGVSYHGIALNVSVRLADFALIDACGLPGVASTSIDRELGITADPTTESVARAAAAFAASFGRAIGAPILGDLPPDGDPVVARARLEAALAPAIHVGGH
jgi:lipoyl(octanoyl) transferase